MYFISLQTFLYSSTDVTMRGLVYTVNIVCVCLHVWLLIDLHINSKGQAGCEPSALDPSCPLFINPVRYASCFKWTSLLFHIHSTAFYLAVMHQPIIYTQTTNTYSRHFICVMLHTVNRLSEGFPSNDKFSLMQDNNVLNILDFTVCLPWIFWVILWKWVSVQICVINDYYKLVLLHF